MSRLSSVRACAPISHAVIRTALLCAALACAAPTILPFIPSARAQDVPPALLDEAVRRTGLSREELLRRYREGGTLPGATAAEEAATPPGLTVLPSPEGAAPIVVLPGAGEGAPTAIERAADAARVEAMEAREGFFGADFFRLEPGVFSPSTFGPVPEDYLVGIGDQIVVDVWGDVEFRLERVVDRDGTIILPKGGRLACWDRTLAQVDASVRDALSRSYSGITAGTAFVNVSLGSLRAIRVFVVGDAVQPGAYELNGVSTIFTALYAAGGPSAAGSWRDVRLMRGSEQIAMLDLYGYLLEGKREGDAILREGDTVFIPRRGPSVSLTGAVHRPLRFELRSGEGLSDLLRFGGGFRTDAATERVHIERVVPPAERLPHSPDRVTRDIAIDPATGMPATGQDASLRDGDVIKVSAIDDRLENWIEVVGNVKRPGRYEWRDGLDVAALIAQAGGLWADTLEERAILDRVMPDGTYETEDFPLGDVLSGRAAAVALRPRDTLRIFSIWDVRERYTVAITGEVRSPGEFPWREGMTLRDLILRAGGLTDAADALQAEVSRLRIDAITNRDATVQPEGIVDLIKAPLGSDFLIEGPPFPLAPHDRVAIRRLPWWELQRVVTLRGEVMFPGTYSLLNPEERLSQLVARSGGLRPTAFPAAARVERVRDGTGNIAIDLVQALAKPGSVYDLVLVPGDVLIVPEIQNTVRVTGAVGFSTSLIFRKGLSLGDYVNNAGGWADGADKWKTRVVYPNGLSRPIKRIWRDPKVLAGSTIVVPVMPQHEDHTVGTLKDIAAIAASVATVWLVIDRTGN